MSKLERPRINRLFYVRYREGMSTDPVWGVAVRSMGEDEWRVVWSDGGQGVYDESFLVFGGEVREPSTYLDFTKEES